MATAMDPHAELANEPRYWLAKASNLHAAAGALWYCMQNNADHAITSSLGLGKDVDMTNATWRVYRMLCGMSLELAYKALAVAKGKKVPHVHDLARLAEYAGIKLLRARDVRLLHLLTECIIWDGRYPIPKSADDLEYFTYLTYESLYRKEQTGERSWALKPLEKDPLDWDEFQGFWRQAIAHFEWIDPSMDV